MTCSSASVSPPGNVAPRDPQRARQPKRAWAAPEARADSVRPAPGTLRANAPEAYLSVTYVNLGPAALPASETARPARWSTQTSPPKPTLTQATRIGRNDTWSVEGDWDWLGLGKAAMIGSQDRRWSTV